MENGNGVEGEAGGGARVNQRGKSTGEKKGSTKEHHQGSESTHSKYRLPGDYKVFLD